MHENREISSTPWSDDQGRSAKAKSRTADMHVLEKSDCVVVPVNQPNKGGQPSAEVGEGRAQTKENIVQSHMHPTQSGKRMSQGLDGVRKVAKERKQERFTALLHHLNVDLLRDSFYALQRKASPGVDGVTWQEYETGLEDRLVDLHRRVHRGAYRAKPSRRVFIPKADGRQRPLGIAALEDKIVQQAVVTILNQIYEVDFKGFSYGFRPGRSPHQALDALTEGIQRKRETFDQCWVSQDRIAQRGVGQPCDHRNLDDVQELPRANTEGREPEDAIAISLHEGLHKPAGLRKRACTQVGFHWDLKQAIRYPLSLRFCFTQTDTSKFGVGKQTIWDLPARGHTVAAG